MNEPVFSPRDMPEGAQDALGELRACIDNIEEGYKDGECTAAVLASFDSAHEVLTRLHKMLAETI